MADLHVIALLVAKPGSADVVRAALTDLVVASRTEAGNLSYSLAESAVEPGTFFTTERWTDQAALDGHMQTAHVAAALVAAGDHLAAAPAIHPLVPVV